MSQAVRSDGSEQRQVDMDTIIHGATRQQWLSLIESEIHRISGNGKIPAASQDDVDVSSILEVAASTRIELQGLLLARTKLTDPSQEELFGMCAGGGAPHAISPLRLKVSPAAILCIKCQEEAERLEADRERSRHRGR